MVTVNENTDINCRSVMERKLQSPAHAHPPLQPPHPYSLSCNNTYRATLLTLDVNREVRNHPKWT